MAGFKLPGKKLYHEPSSAFTGQPVFSQILDLLPKDIIMRASVVAKSNRYGKRFIVYDPLVTGLYTGFFPCNSLPELITGLPANAGRLAHLGLKDTPRRSPLSDANTRRDNARHDIPQEMRRNTGSKI